MKNGDTETALLVEVPAAEPYVAQYRSKLDTNAGLGIPAHITVLAPFVPAGNDSAGTGLMFCDIMLPNGSPRAQPGLRRLT